MNMRKYFLGLFLSLFALQSVLAAALPVSNTQNAVSGVLQAKIAKRGFAANDPRWSATLQQAGVSIAGAAAAGAVITAAAITAPAWVTAAAAIALSTLFSTAINLAIDGTVSWYQNTDGTVTIAGKPSPPPPMGSMWWYYNGKGYPVGQDSANTICNDFWASPTRTVTADAQYECIVSDNATPQLQPVVYLPQSATPDPNYRPPGSTPFTGTPSAVVNSLSSTDLAKPANPTVVAGIADAAWKNAAAQPGYSGIPYDASNPVTAADATAWQATNPTAWPTVGDLVMPQAAPVGGTAASPFQLPNTATPVSSVEPGAATNTGTNPSTQPLANLGADPGIGAPALEATPSAQAILAPVLGLLPSLRNFVVPSHQSTCPTPSADVFGKHLVLDAQCTMAESSRGTLYAVMAFVWLLAALLIILAA